MIRKFAVPCTSLALFLLVWIISAQWVADAQILPKPQALLQPFWQELQSGDLAYHLGQTLIRVAWAFLLAMSIGFAIGFAMGRSPGLNHWLDPWLVVFLNLPALVLIVLCYLWIGLTEAAAIAAVTLNKIPNVAITIREGARALSSDADALAKVYNLNVWTQLRHIHLPQMAPFIAAAARGGIAVIWKIVLVVELLGRSNGVGFQIHLFFQLFDVGMVLVYAFSFIAVMLFVEWVVVQPWERSTRRWRQA